MADLVFNQAKGKVAYYAGLPGANDGLVVVPLEAAGLATDDILRDQTTLAGVLSVATQQATMGRKAIASVTVTVDHGNDWTDVDLPADPAWPGATGNPCGALVICYDPDIASGTDADIIPLTKHDFVVEPNGTEIVAQISASGFYRAI